MSRSAIIRFLLLCITMSFSFTGVQECSTAENAKVILEFQHLGGNEWEEEEYTVTVYSLSSHFYSVEFIGGPSNPNGESFSLEFVGPYHVAFQLACRPEQSCSSQEASLQLPRDANAGDYFFARIKYQYEFDDGSESTHFFYVDADLEVEEHKYRILVQFIDPEGYEFIFNTDAMTLQSGDVLNSIQVAFNVSGWLEHLSYSQAQITETSGEFGEDGTIFIDKDNNPTLLRELLENIQASTTASVQTFEDQ